MGTCERICACVVFLCALLRASQWRHGIGGRRPPTLCSGGRRTSASFVSPESSFVCVLLKEDPTWVRASWFFFCFVVAVVFFLFDFFFYFIFFNFFSLIGKFLQ